MKSTLIILLIFCFTNICNAEDNNSARLEYDKTTGILKIKVYNNSSNVPTFYCNEFTFNFMESTVSDEWGNTSLLKGVIEHNEVPKSGRFISPGKDNIYKAKELYNIFK